MSKKSKEQTIIDTQSSDFVKVIEDTVKYMQEEVKGAELPSSIQNQIIDECIKVENQIKIQDTPPNPQIRNEFGLIKGLNYHFSEDGAKIDWRKMLDDKYLVPNKQNFIKRGQNVPNSIEGLEDKDLVVLLQGFRTLADIKGYTSVDYQIITSTSSFCSVKCTIKWIKNFEGPMEEYSSTADAHYDSVDGIFRNYLTTMAENRAFQRCIRNALKINICARDEVGPVKEVEEEQSQDDLPYQLLDKLMKEKGLNFDRIKKKCVLENVTGAENFNTIKDIPKATVSNLIGKLNKYKPE